MWQAEDVIILSDLHIAAERGAGLFRADAELAEFFRWVREETRDTLILLNGDILDYLVVKDESPAYAYNLKELGPRTNSIIEHHPEVFDALSLLACSDKHQVVFMSGNHDPELAFPSVRRALEARFGVGVGGASLGWLVHGVAATIGVGTAKVIVEHGDYFDSWNRVDHSALRYTVGLESRGLLDYHEYKFPIGSRLVIDHLAHLRTSHPWIDVLKPEREAVFPLLLEVMPVAEKWRYKGALRKYALERTESAISKIRRKVKPVGVFKGESGIDERGARFMKWLNDLDKGEVKGAGGPMSNGFIELLRQVSAEDFFFDPDVAEGNREDLEFMIESGADLLVHGHTHAAKAHRLGAGLYLNSGTWGRLLRLPMSYDSDETWGNFLTELLGGADNSFLRPTFIRVRAAGDSARAALFEWKGNAETLSSWLFNGERRAWRQEK